MQRWRLFLFTITDLRLTSWNCRANRKTYVQMARGHNTHLYLQIARTWELTDHMMYIVHACWHCVDTLCCCCCVQSLLLLLLCNSSWGVEGGSESSGDSRDPHFPEYQWLATTRTYIICILCDHEAIPSHPHPHPPHNIGHYTGTGRWRIPQKHIQQTHKTQVFNLTIFRKHISEMGS